MKEYSHGSFEDITISSWIIKCIELIWNNNQHAWLSGHSVLHCLGSLKLKDWVKIPDYYLLDQ